MKILLISPKISLPKNLLDINGFTGMWFYYLYHGLQKVNQEVDVEIIPDSKNQDEVAAWFDSLDLSKYYAVICVGLRYFSTVPKEIGERLRSRSSAVICQLYDGSRLDNDPVDITFTFRDDAWRYPLGSAADRYNRHHTNNKYVGWAADPEICSPQQDKSMLRILVDHPAFDHMTPDRSLDTLVNIKALKDSTLWQSQYSQIIVRRFISEAVETVDLNNITVRPYDRRGVSYVDACREYSQADIFCVTHNESVGQSVIEAATAGALILTPKGFINADRLATVRAVEWERSVDWPVILSCLDTDLSRKVALQNNWKNIIQTMLGNIRERYKHKKAEMR